MTVFRFKGGEIVRLREDCEELKAGCCGVLWGVYDMQPPMYEACFVDATGETDMTFEEHQVDEVHELRDEPFRQRLEEIRQLLSAEESPAG